MAFRINDLIVNIASGAEGDSDGPRFCPEGTCLFCSVTPEVTRIRCIAYLSVCHYISPMWTTIYYLCNAAHPPSFGVLLSSDPRAAEDILAGLKAQLKDALAEIEMQQSALKQSVEPRSNREIEMLEEKLDKALKTLRQRREQMKEPVTRRRKAAPRRKTTRKHK